MLIKEFEECFENNKYREKMLEYLIPSEIGEIHHIVPRSYFKAKGLKIIDNDNTIKIGYENHIWVHYYAWKCAKPIIKKQMVYAINFVLNNSNRDLKTLIKDYSIIREEIAELSKYQKTNKQIICLENKEIFNSLGEASRKYDIDKRLISAVCNNKRKIAGGYHWCFLENYNENLLEEIMTKSKPNSFKPKKIICLENEKIYNSAREVEKETGISFKNISDCALKNIKTAGGYHWSFYYENIDCKKEIEEIDNIIITRDGSKYNRKYFYCLQNNKKYKSISEAAKDLKISQPYLSRQIKKGKPAKGFTFEISN